MATVISEAVDRLVMQVSAVVADRSEVRESDRESFVTIRSEVQDLTTKWGQTSNAAMSLAAQVAAKLQDLKKLIWTKDGHQDLEGTTDLYRKLVESDLVKILDSATDPDGRPMPITMSTFRNRMKEARSRYRMNYATAAQIAVERDPELAATKVPVNQVKTDPDTGEVVEKDGVPITETVEMEVAEIVALHPPGVTSKMETPEVLNEAVAEVFSEIRDEKGNPVSGFTPEDIPPTFGIQPKPKRKQGSGKIVGSQGPQPDSTNVEPPNGAKVARWARQTNLVEVLTFLLRVLTSASDAAIGEPGKAAPNPNPVIPGADREAILDLFAQVGGLSFETGKVLGGKPGASKVNKVAPLRWSDPTAEKLAEMLAQTQAGTGSTEPEPETTEPETAPETTTEAVLETLTTPDSETVPETTTEAAPKRRRRK